jgi:hypothetical protein
MRNIARLGAVIAVAGSLGLGLGVPAQADTSNFGQMVDMCAHMMLPYDIASDGSIVMTMPNGTVCYFQNFGAMVTYMQHQMC